MIVHISDKLAAHQLLLLLFQVRSKIEMFRQFTVGYQKVSSLRINRKNHYVLKRLPVAFEQGSLKLMDIYTLIQMIQALFNFKGYIQKHVLQLFIITAEILKLRLQILFVDPSHKERQNDPIDRPDIMVLAKLQNQIEQEDFHFTQLPDVGNYFGTGGLMTDTGALRELLKFIKASLQFYIPLIYALYGFLKPDGPG